LGRSVTEARQDSCCPGSQRWDKKSQPRRQIGDGGYDIARVKCELIPVGQNRTEGDGEGSRADRHQTDRS